MLFGKSKQTTHIGDLLNILETAKDYGINSVSLLHAFVLHAANDGKSVSSVMGYPVGSIQYVIHMSNNVYKLAGEKKKDVTLFELIREKNSKNRTEHYLHLNTDGKMLALKLGIINQ